MTRFPGCGPSGLVGGPVPAAGRECGEASLDPDPSRDPVAEDGAGPSCVGGDAEERELSAVPISAPQREARPEEGHRGRRCWSMLTAAYFMLRDEQDRTTTSAADTWQDRDKHRVAPAPPARRLHDLGVEVEVLAAVAMLRAAEPAVGGRRRLRGLRRTKADWAVEVAGLLEGTATPTARPVTLVCDNLNTHTKGAFYEVFEPVRARELVRRHRSSADTPKHGSWLNIAENELSALTRQCLRGRRIGDLEATLHSEVSAWSGDVNGTQRGGGSTGR